MTGRGIPSARDRTVEHRRPTRSEIAHARTVAERLQAAREAARAAAQAQSASASSDWLTAWERRRDEQEIDR